MRIDAISDSTFAAEVLESDKPVLVDFTASWCPPCRAMNPILDEVAAGRDDLRIVKLDVDENQATAAQYGVMSMPTFMLFANGTPIQTLVGSRPRKRLESELSEALAQQPAGR